MELPDVVAVENFPELLDPLVLGEDGELEPRGLGDGDNLLQISVDILLILKTPARIFSFIKKNQMLKIFSRIYFM